MRVCGMTCVARRRCFFVPGGYAMRCSESVVIDVARDMYMVFVLGLRSRPAAYMYVYTYRWMEVTGVVDTNVYRVESIEYFWWC